MMVNEKNSTCIYVKGLSALDDGVENARILQKAIDCGGEIVVDVPGVYLLAKTILIGDHTSGSVKVYISAVLMILTASTAMRLSTAGRLRARRTSIFRSKVSG